jgi:hypothetical protein
MKVTQITIKVYMKHHIFPSYAITFEKEESANQFIDSINNDIDYVRIGDDVVERKKIKKMVFKYE